MIYGAGLVHLAKLEALETLNLEGCKKITDAGLKILARLKAFKGEESEVGRNEWPIFKENRLNFFHPKLVPLHPIKQIHFCHRVPKERIGL